MRFLNTLLNIIFPIKCISCGASGIDVCILCLSTSPPPERENASWIFSVYDYRHPLIKKALWLFKYKNKKRLSNIFAEIIYDKIIEELSELSILENFREPLLIPIPISKKRCRERGYNQTELICKELIKLNNARNGIDYLILENNVLVKPKHTEHQAHIKNRRDRLRNLSGSFAIDDTTKIKNRNIILIDDVTTTGATLSEARKSLKHAGAKKIIAFTVAH